MLVAVASKVVYPLAALCWHVHPRNNVAVWAAAVRWMGWQVAPYAFTALCLAQQIVWGDVLCRAAVCRRMLHGHVGFRHSQLFAV